MQITPEILIRLFLVWTSLLLFIFTRYSTTMLIDEWLNEVSGYSGSKNVADEQGCEMDIRLHTDSSILLKYLSKKFVTINLFQVGQVRDH